MHLFQSIESDISTHFGARPDKTHIAGKDIDQLRQFVQFILSDKISRTGHTRITITDRNKTLPVGTDTHGAELEQSKIPIAASDTRLSIKNRTVRVEFDPDSKKKK